MKTKSAEKHVPYEPQEIEPRWQQTWESDGIYRSSETRDVPKYYCLDYFPYPSGEGLHVGHCRNYIPTDLISRYKRMKGFNVLHPMGWDAFGEPTEHHAVLRGISPRESTDRNTANYKRQMKMIGTSYDWEREIDSSSPEFYHWTQVMFVRMYEQGLSYWDTNWQWWCPTCATTLSSNEIDGEKCWRGHKGVTKKEIPAWYFKITAYADELLSGLEEVDWPEPVKAMQVNWIGRSEGVEVLWEVDIGKLAEDSRKWVDGLGQKGGEKGDDSVGFGEILIGTFTTRVDTIFGVTFLALAPEHPAVMKLSGESQKAEVTAYVKQAMQFSDIDRTAEGREVTGVFSGRYARHPITSERIPIYVADYVLPTYGSGAVMGVPAHDQRDFVFARKFGLEIREVIRGLGNENSEANTKEEVHTGPGVMVSSGLYDGMDNLRAQEMITEMLEKSGRGSPTVNTHLRDWLISRQRYWGTPIPIVHCEVCGLVPVPENDLPVMLPEVADYSPDGSGKSPLARVDDFVNTSCPKCGGPARRETDTMGGFACSSWYFLRFTSPQYSEGPFAPDSMNYWMPVDLYVGGTEHAVLHLLYARFWTKVLADEGSLPFREPFTKLINQGQLHGTDGLRMSKSRGNVIVPDGLVHKYGADALRIHCLFIAPFDQRADWQEDGLIGARRFLNKVWSLFQNYGIGYKNTLDTDVRGTGKDDPGSSDDFLERERHRIIKGVSERIERFRFNTMVSCLMEFVNLLADHARESKWKTTTFQNCLKTLLILLAPVAPHVTEELWRKMGFRYSIHQQPWPEWEEGLITEETIMIPVQVNGRRRGAIQVKTTSTKDEVIQAAIDDPEINRVLQADIIRSIYVPGKILSIVIEELRVEESG